MRKAVSLFLATLTLLSAGVGAGCNGSGSGVGITLKSNAATVSHGVAATDQGQSITITATVTNDGAGQGVTWNLNGPGSLSNRTATRVTYNAPATVSAPVRATVTATSVAQSSTSAQFAISVSPPPVITTESLPDGVVNVLYSSILNAKWGTGDYTWSISSGSLPDWAELGYSLDGEFIGGKPDATGTWNFSLSVKDSAGLTSKPQALSLTINTQSPSPLSIATKSLPDGTVGIPYASGMQADGGVPPYRWRVSIGSLPSWASLDAGSGVISCKPDSDSVTSFTIEVSDSQSTPAVDTQDLTIRIKTADSANDAELNGHYAFLLQGFDDATGNRFAAVGSFLAGGNGKITGGVEDLNGPGGYKPELTFIGTYNVGSDNRGYATFTSSSGERTTFAFAVGGLKASHVATKVSLIEFDDMDGATGGQGSGSARRQDTGAFDLASINGPYAFQMTGQAEQPGTRAVVTGAYAADGKGKLSSGDEEVNNNGKAEERSFNGTFSSSAETNSFGRVTLRGLAGSDASQSVGYIVDSGQMLAMTTGEESNAGLFTGKVLARSGDSFSSVSLDSTSTGYSVGLDSVGIGRFTFDGMNNGSYVYVEEYSDQINYVSQYPFSTTFSYRVSANGRVTATGSGRLDGAVFYLTDANEGFWMGTGKTVTVGFFEPRTGASSANQYLAGNLLVSTVAPGAAGWPVAAGVATSSGNPGLAVTFDMSSNRGLLSADQTDSGEFLFDANGLGRDDEFIPSFLYMISPNKAVVMWGWWQMITIIGQ